MGQFFCIIFDVDINKIFNIMNKINLINNHYIMNKYNDDIYNSIITIYTISIMVC